MLERLMFVFIIIESPVDKYELDNNDTADILTIPVCVS